MQPLLLWGPLLLLFFAAPAVAVVALCSRALAAWTAALAMAGGLAILSPVMARVIAGEVVVTRTAWLSEWGLDLSLRLDGLGLLFALLILCIGLLIVLYAVYYMPVYDKLGRFLALLVSFAGAMLGVVLSENLLLMVVFWELTSLTSFLLIAYKHETADARIAARMALAVTGAGGLALLAGVLLLGQIAGSYDLSVVLGSGDSVRGHALYPVVLGLVLLGAFTKSAQFPFHFWLPNAMSAPTPVSAYLHSATMVKAGVFLLARLYPVLSGTDAWLIAVGGTGAVTFVYGAYVALLKHDFKGLLAYSTMSHLGLVTLLLGLDTPMSAVAAVFHIINHAIFKASLFMAAGIIDHECGTRDMRNVNGLFRYMPRTAVLGIVAAGAMAGVPLLNGFLSKEMFFAETVGHPAFHGAMTWLLPLFATVAGMLSVAYSARFVHDVFFNGEPVDLPRTPHEPPGWMRLPVEILVFLVLLVGLFPQHSVGALLRSAVAPLLPGGVPPFTLSVWHGWNLPLAMSIAAFGLGLLHYVRRHHLFRLHDRFMLKLSSPVAFERVYKEAATGAAWITENVLPRSVKAYVALVIAFVLLAGGWAWTSAQDPRLSGSLSPTPVDMSALAGLVVLGVGSLGTVMFHRRRLVAAMMLSLAGLAVALVFVRFSAPDLALTQLSVEVVTIVLILLALRFLPSEIARTRWSMTDSLAAALSLAAGVGAGALSYAMLSRPYATISGYHIANSVPEGGGANVVNVILVDFRGFDTLGEITVLAMAALGLRALLEGLRLRPYSGHAELVADRHPIMLAELMRPLLPLALAVSAYIFLRGHNLPGGGFIAGLIAAAAVMLQYLAMGIDFASERVRLDLVRVMGWGLGVATATGAASFGLGFPFLTSTHGHAELPFVGEIELASAMAFDLGVFLVVLGCVLMCLTELGNLSRRELGGTSTERAG